MAETVPPTTGLMSSWFSVKNLVPRTILPFNTRADAASAAAATALQAPAKSLVATKSYDEAVEACKKKVEKIAKECRRFNRKYRDQHFDLTLDQDYCLEGLEPRIDGAPETSARVDEIFEDPVFFKDGATAGDVEQGMVCSQHGDPMLVADRFAGRRLLVHGSGGYDYES